MSDGITPQHVTWHKPENKMPKDGIPVIAAFKNSLGEWRRVRATHYGDYQLPLSDEAEFYPGCTTYKDYGGSEDPDDLTDYIDYQVYCPSGWYETNELEETHWTINNKILLWTPLPELPE